MSILEDGNIHLWQKAASLAARFHTGQLRKDGRTPYVVHPFRVAMIVRDIFNVSDPVILAAALLHDVIEDTAADYDDVLEECGREVAEIVAAMTKDMRLPESEREPAYDRQLQNASWKARLVKLADVYDNICDSKVGIQRRKTSSKAPRAIEISENDPELQDAIKILTQLYDKLNDDTNSA